MSTAVLNYIAYIALAEDNRVAGSPLPELHGDDRLEIVVRHADGATEQAVVPPEAARAVYELIARLYAGGRVAVLEDERELTPNEASEILGMSRPLVVRRMEVGELPFHYVGTHRRCRLADVLALKACEDERRRVADALAADTDDLRKAY